MISQKRYVNIVSGVGAGAVAAERKLIMRVMTRNPMLPPGLVFEFSDVNVVADFFGMQSEEYRRAAKYFAFINKNIQAPRTIAFARWVSEAIPSMVVGDSMAKSLSGLVAQNAGSLNVNFGGEQTILTGINLSSATNLTQVASLLTEVFDAEWPGVAVSFDTNTNIFSLTSSGAGPASPAISIQPTGEPTDLSTRLGWGTSGSVLVAGQNADTPALAIQKSAGISNNFGSFVFDNSPGFLSVAQVTEVAEWNHAQNNMYMYSVPVPLAQIATLFAAVRGFSGTALNVLSTTALNDFIEQAPCEITASINYNQPAANQNYMFYQFADRNVTVSDDTTANLADRNRGNYIGVTQSAGQPLAFYQRGILCGGSQAAVDMNIYANEMWLKSAISSSFLTLFLSVGAVPANDDGAATLLAVMQPTITLAGNNGVFSFGKQLTAVQKEYIGQITGDRDAWRQVQSLGYWVNISFESYVNTNTGLTEWKAVYQLIYSKGDVIRLVEGSDVMI